MCSLSTDVQVLFINWALTISQHLIRTDDFLQTFISVCVAQETVLVWLKGWVCLEPDTQIHQLFFCSLYLVLGDGHLVKQRRCCLLSSCVIVFSFYVLVFQSRPTWSLITNYWFNSSFNLSLVFEHFPIVVWTSKPAQAVVIFHPICIVHIVVLDSLLLNDQSCRSH